MRQATQAAELKPCESKGAATGPMDLLACLAWSQKVFILNTIKPILGKGRRRLNAGEVVGGCRIKNVSGIDSKTSRETVVNHAEEKDRIVDGRSLT